MLLYIVQPVRDQILELSDQLIQSNIRTPADLQERRQACVGTDEHLLHQTTSQTLCRKNPHLCRTFVSQEQLSLIHQKHQLNNMKTEPRSDPDPNKHQQSLFTLPINSDRLVLLYTWKNTLTELEFLLVHSFTAS